MNALDSTAEIFDVFLCHNSEDKPAVREIAQKLSEENIKAWLDEADIKAGSFWHSAIGQQIETVKSAAVFIGQYGVGPWQNRQMIALLDQFDRRGCPVIPVILASAPAEAALPWSLVGLHCIDFRATDSHPLKRLVWSITGERPAELAHLAASEKPVTMRGAVKAHLFPGGDDRAAASKGRFGDLEISKARYYPPLTTPPDPEQAGQLEILRRRVTEYWVDGVLKHSLHNEVLISLGKRGIDRAIDAPWKYTVEVSAATSPLLEDRDVNAIYDATGLLLILGEPGSGKTTTLLDLARTLLERVRDDIKERVPIVLNLSSWKKNQLLAEWISDELSEKYRVPRKIARFWLQNDYLLPLLDGLDEVQTVTQPDCVTAINAFIEEFSPPGLVVCCRLSEYRWLPKRLKLNGAICIEPLSSQEVSKYLDAGGAKLAALRGAVDADPVIHELAQTPLMLSIMSLAYQGVAGDELATQKGDSEERRKQIFGLYIEQMFHRKGMTSLAFPKEMAIGWLSWLARKMRGHSETVFLVEGLQPSWLDTTAQWVVYGAAVALSLGLSGALIGGLSGGLVGRLIYGLRGGLIAGLFAGLSIGVIAALTAVRSTLRSAGWSDWKMVLLLIVTAHLIGMLKMDSWLVSWLVGPIYVGIIVGPIVGSLNHITLVETGWKWIQFWKRTIPGLIGGMSAWLMLKLITDGLDDRETLTIGLFCALICGLVSGLVDRSICGVKMSKASPNQGIKLSRKNALVASLISCFTVGLIFGLSAGPIFGLRLGLVGGLIFGLIFGLIVGLNRGASAVIKHYALRLILWLSGNTPFNFIKFLDHCANLILLKKVGGGYIFIHRMLLDYFADLNPQAAKTGKTKSVTP